VTRSSLISSSSFIVSSPFQTNIGRFKEETSVRRRFSDFLWLNEELKRLTLLALPELPNKKLTLRAIPFFNKLEASNFVPEFIEQRQQELQDFINKVAQHPLAQNQKCLHMFLQDQFIDRRYKPGTV
jgi:sorting nexin-4